MPLECVCMQIFISPSDLVYNYNCYAAHFLNYAFLYISRWKGDDALYQENQIKLCPESTKLTLYNGLCKTGNRLDTYTEQDQSAVAKYEQFMAWDIQGHQFQIRVSPVLCTIDSGSNVSSSTSKLSNCITYADIINVFPSSLSKSVFSPSLFAYWCKLCDIRWKASFCSREACVNTSKS